MTLAEEIISLKLGSPELNAIRDAATKGDLDALKKYLYFGALQAIRADRFIPADKKIKVFQKLLDADLVEVKLGE